MCHANEFRKFADRLTTMTEKRQKKKDEKGSRKQLVLSSSSLGGSGGSYDAGSDDDGEGDDLGASMSGHFTAGQLKALEEVLAPVRNQYGDDCVAIQEDLGLVRLTLKLPQLKCDRHLMDLLHIEEDRKVVFDFDYKGSVSEVPSRATVGLLKVEKDKSDHAACHWLADVCAHGINLWNKDRKRLEEFAKEMELETWSFKMEDDARKLLGKEMSFGISSPTPPSKSLPESSWGGKLANIGKRFFGAPKEPETNTLEPEKKKQESGKEKEEAKTEVKEEQLDSLLEMGFDPFVAFVALQCSSNKVDDAVRFLFDNKDGLPKVPEGANDSLAHLVGSGVQRINAIQALLQTNFDRSAALSLSKGEKKVEPKAQQGKMTTKDNFFVKFLTFATNRFQHYTRYCVSCHAVHNCASLEGVVCAEPLCVFRWEELHLGELIPTSQCCFEDCGHTDLGAKAMAYFGEPVGAIAKRYDMPVQTILEMVFHKYLPGPEMKKFLQAVTAIQGKKKIVNVLNPRLCARFEKRFKEMRDQGITVSPEVAYHGTAEKNVDSILDTGFLLNKLASGTGDRGWYGAGIYFSPNAQVSMGYSRGGKRLIVASVLRGRVWKCPKIDTGCALQKGYDSHTDPQGNAEWVIFHEESILPCFTVNIQ